MFKKAIVVSPDDEKKVYDFFAQKIPVYYGSDADTSNSYNHEALEAYRKLQYPDIQHSKESETNFLKTSIIAFPAGITPCYRWVDTKQELIKQNDIGVIFCNGVNFEGKSTSDYHNYSNANDSDSETTKEEKFKRLTEYIDNIMLSLIIAAHTLTVREQKNNCELRIPQIGLGQFANFYNNLFILQQLYLEALIKAIEKIQDSKFQKISFDIILFNFYGDNKYYTLYKELFTKIKKYKNITSYCHGRNISIFSFPASENESLTVIAHAGDQHAFLGNGGFLDTSLERKLLGDQNDHFLTLIHLLNFFLPEIASNNNQKTSEEEPKNNILIDSKDKLADEASPNNITMHRGIFCFGLGLAILYIYFKREAIKYIIDCIYSYLKRSEKCLNQA